MTTPIQTDVVIIGAGPVGLFAIFECGMNNLKCHVIDAFDGIGGQCSALYPEKPIYDIPAHPFISGQGLIDNLMAQAKAFDPVFHLSQQVVTVETIDRNDPNDFGFYLKTSKGTEFNARAVIIAAGVGAFGPNRPPLEGVEQFEGKSVFYHVKSKADFAGKKIVIAGGGDSAVDWALSLSEIAERVSVIHRRPKFRCAPDSESKLNALAKEGKIDLVIPYQLAALDGANGHLSHVIVETLDGVKKSIEADVLLPFFGLSMNLGPILEWGLGLEKNHIAIEPGTASTSIPGIFAIGDVATYTHKQKLILCGFAEAAQASQAIRAMLHPGEVFHFEYSTTKGIPQEKSNAA
ncbi:MAG: NAD(P)/FAD-dependent oxidoreductase [Alphaproteobacteria bacterium]|nr:NAD(P)/FAD-dependent oxidoreductase [Alphaproteobacteria bacterium]